MLTFLPLYPPNAGFITIGALISAQKFKTSSIFFVKIRSGTGIPASLKIVFVLNLLSAVSTAIKLVLLPIVALIALRYFPVPS